MSEQPTYRGEKEEKREEKQRSDEEKRREKQEKSWDEKWRRDPLSAAVWALVLIWLGVALVLGNLGLLAGLHVWSVFFVGAAVLLLLEVAFRYLVPAYRQPARGRLVLALIFLALGLGELVGWAVVGSLVLIIIGVAILLGTLVWWRR